MQVYINQVLGEVNKPGAVFKIGFWKADGSYTTKSGIISRVANLENRKKMNRNGLLRCFDKPNGQAFDVTIDLIMTFNDMKIIRPE